MSATQELKSLLGEPAQRKALLQALEPKLSADLYQRLYRVIELIGWLLEVLEQKNVSIVKLRKLCFGAPTEKSMSPAQTKKKTDKTKVRGHGRHSHRDYTGAKRVKVPHPTLRSGNLCPDCTRGKLRPRKEPAVCLHMRGQPPIGAVVYEREQLRCDTCGALFTAPLPAEASNEKYDPSVGVMSALMRYGSGMPFHRLERLQQALGVPLSSSVQWEQVDRVQREFHGVFNHLIELAAQGPLFFSDDTTMRVAALRQEIDSQEKPKRKGIFTTAIAGQWEDHPIILFYTGRAHAGENLKKVLDRRQSDRSPPLHMCDGLDRNRPEGHTTVGCQCNVHARRNFVEIKEAFPEQSAFVIDCFAKVYKVEKEAATLDPQQRIQLHQTLSRPVMEKLGEWLEEQIQERKAEPNSTLGQAINYMRQRWSQLTRFLEEPAAPLDNNIAERILKMSIMHRKNSMFYRTQYGAQVGDLFMSIIQTCRANQVNPFDYLQSIIRNTKSAETSPDRWLPWNYHRN